MRSRCDRASAPHALQELVAGEDAALLAGERVHEPKLRRGQLRALAVDERLHVVGVEAELLDHDRVAAARLGLADAAAGRRAHARGQLLEGERLDEVVVRADLERVHAVVLRSARGDDDDRSADPSERACSMTRQPSIPGKHEVEHADVGPLVAKAGEPGLAVRDADRVEARRLEVARHAASDDVVVLDDQDLRHPAT